MPESVLKYTPEGKANEMLNNLTIAGARTAGKLKINFSEAYVREAEETL